MICPHHNDCFTCPLPDCRLEAHLAPKANELEMDREKFRAVESHKKKGSHGRKTGT